MNGQAAATDLFQLKGSPDRHTLCKITASLRASAVRALPGPHRLAIANANVPNMVGQISTAMAKAGLNIHNMLNKSRGEMAYTLVDVDSPIPPPVVDAISAIDGVLSVRAIPAEDMA